MKVLIAIMSCARDKNLGAHDLVRRTWKVADVDSVHTRFFVGDGCSVDSADEIQVRADDANHTAKVKAIFSWALGQDYDYVFKCDTDTYVHVPRLLSSGFEQHEWSGGYGSLDKGPYGGSGYWICRNLMQRVLQDGLDSRTARPWDEDRWIGENLIALGYRPCLDKRYNSDTKEGPEKNNGVITAHWYAERQSYSGPVEPPPVLVSSTRRLSLFDEHFKKAQEIR